MPEATWDAEIELRAEPFRVKVGEVIYEFFPEVESSVLLDSYRQLKVIREKSRLVSTSEGEPDADEIEDLVSANRQYVAGLMLAESSKAFLAKPPPDRVIVLMTQKIMEHYGGADVRPTTSSSESSGGRSTNGRRSTGRSRSKG